ncbi:AraC-like DNA-binding protein [Paenibacillus sp. V4I3]|uniref:helix-turn-helix domain-containing protein n=1 Tax=unclassified Paenibacillus TaxID=185978 RepID=UPI00277D4EF5|nr:MULTISPECIES: helix-turn-helix domain-containing protein [unclassified Paenibacillus]MDQ0877334.1 AraC-like DNA-binding protein [Paenibacillus sp. V4I3]MDQ0886801.1 AraC-like DNA-binding protein [Paenibacillus sp. V4I9]
MKSIRSVLNFKQNGLVKGNYFRKSLILVLLITSIPSTLIALSNYIIGTQQIEKEVFKQHKLKIEQFSDSMNEQFAQIELVMSRWSTNSMFSDQLENLVFIDHISQTHDLMQSLLVVSGSNSLIEDAQLFLTRQKAVLGWDGIHYLNEQQLNRYQAILKNPKGIVWEYGMPDFSAINSAYSASILLKLPWQSQEPFGAFVLHFSQSALGETMNHFLTDGQGIALLIRPSGEWVVEPDERTKSFQEMIRTNIMERAGQDDAFQLKWQGGTYVVSSGQVSATGWIYATASPLTELTKPVVLTSKLILSAGILGILASIILAWYASNRLYRPIKRLVSVFQANRNDLPANVKHEMEFIEESWTYLTEESLSLQHKLTQSLPLLRESFLLQLAQGHLYALRETELKSRMQQLGWQADDRIFSLLLIRLSGVGEESGRFRENDTQLITFAAANIIQELSGGLECPSYVINFQDLSVGLLSFHPDQQSKEDIRNELFVLAKELMDILHKVLGTNITVIVGKLAHQAGGIPDILEQARQAARYRDLQEDRQIIDMEEVTSSELPQAFYPFTEEKELLQVMRLGMEEESYSRLDSFLEELEHKADREMMIQQSLFQLVASMRHMFMESGFLHHPVFTEANLLEELLIQREPAVLKKWVKQKIMAPYLEDFHKQQNVRAKQLIGQVIELLSEQYMKDLSLDECAQLFATNPFSLSRSFKQITGTNYVDYIAKLRIDKAKELLSTTYLKVSEIAERVGYQHSYFNKIFKGSEGLTPTQYREKFKN